MPYLNALHISIRCVIFGCENGLVVLLGCLLSSSHLLCSGNTIWFIDTEHLLEALLEVIREESIENWVGTGVDIGENDQGEVESVSSSVLGDDVNQVDNVGSEEGQPTKYKHQHDDHHHACHLALRFTALSATCTHTS